LDSNCSPQPLEPSVSAVLEEISYALRRIKTSESTILLGDVVIGRHSDGDVNENGRLLLQLWCNNALCIMNTFFQHRDMHKYTWCRDSLGQWPLIDFCIVSADLLHSVLDVRVKRCA